MDLGAFSVSLAVKDIETSKRNSAGRRTAWLRPFLKSLAVCMSDSSIDDIYPDLYHPTTGTSSGFPDGFVEAVQGLQQLAVE